MTPGELAAVRGRLEEFAAEMFTPLARRDQRDKGVTYVRGLLLDGRRKSMQPMAERLGVDHQGLQQFLSSSTWAVAPVRERLARRAVAVIAPEAWVVDDTGFPKDGAASPGVARQYSGTLGKVANCQIGVSVQAVTDAASCPLDWRLFLPGGWDAACADDEQAAGAARTRRARAGIGDDVRHREKWRLAIDMLDELAGWGLTPPVVVADAGYGDAGEFRTGIAERGWSYVVQVRGDLVAHRADAVPERLAYARRGRPPRGRHPRRARPPAGGPLPQRPGRPARPRTSRRPRRRGADHLAAGLPRAAHLPVRGPAGPPGRTGAGRPEGRRRLAARGMAARRVAARGRRAHRLLAVQPGRGHPAGRTGPAGQDPLADRA